uniref:AB hydrolase-1 domain-containing protein n=1 Tax=Globisporangium ultimum (strain ATCC 200006 / CBS 805.95 / DAOM BR144) TaxID=431595 RepID=K3X983_GLOUD
MRWGPLITITALLSSASFNAFVGANTDAKLRINGWYECSDSIANSDLDAPHVPFECAEVEVPLCHEGICESDKRINLFVRRLLANPKTPVAKQKALWFLQGGPGLSSFVLEDDMKNMNALFQGTVDLYTMDHRGTGRSTFLECKAAQAYAEGGANGVNIDFVEIPNCIRDILFQIDNHTEALSTMSAAKDVEYLIDNLYDASVDTYIYGVSYGTYWAERIIHLASEKVKGYVLDGVMPEDTPTFATWNSKRMSVEERFLAVCENDDFCSSRLTAEIKEYGDLKTAWTSIYNDLDAASVGTNECADLLRSAFKVEKPSYGLRAFFAAKFIGVVHMRILIPAIMHRLYYCEAQDVEFLKGFFGVSDWEDPTEDDDALLTPVYDQVQRTSFFLAQLIKASEMWTFPLMSWESAMQDFDAGLFSQNVTLDFDSVCFFRTNFSGPACAQVVEHYPEIDFETLETPEYRYTPDAKYYHKFAKIPDHASVLIFNGKLDVLTTSDWGAKEYEHLDGKKMMVDFDYGAHGTGLRQTTLSDGTFCGYHIIVSYVVADGQVDKVNTSCMSKLPDIGFADLNAIQNTLPGITSVDELYGDDSTEEADESD